MIRKKQRQTLVVAGLIVLTLLFGILPILKRDDRELSKFGYRAGDRIDVAVIGMEPEGIAAAVAAARAGMNTLLITSEPDPASYMSSCLLNHMIPQEGRIDGRKVTLAGPVFRDMFGGVESTFTESTYLRNMLRVLADESRLKTMYNATLTGVASDARSVSSVTLYAGGEMKTIRASVFIDATEGGLLLDKLQVPYTRGSEDLGAKGFFEPLSFNFRIRGINWDDMRTIAKVGEYGTALSDVLMAYPRSDGNIKLESPALIRQDEDGVLVTGLRVAFVDPGDPKALNEAYNACIREAMHLTAYLRSELVPFSKVDWDMAATRLFVPENRHYAGMAALGVSDLLENRDWPDKVAVLSDPAVAGRFVRGDNPSVLCHPNAYAVPLGCLIPQGWRNVMMLGSKAGFTSLAATGAGTVSARTVVGEGAGLAAAYCVMEGVAPADVSALPADALHGFVAYMERAGQQLPDLHEALQQKDGTPLSAAWMYEDVKNLVVHGVLLGGNENDFRIPEACSSGTLKLLAKNALLRMTPERYTLELDKRISDMPAAESITTEAAATLLIALAGQERPEGAGKASDWLFAWMEGGGGYKVPAVLRDHWKEAGSATSGELYHLVNQICLKLAALPK